MELGTEPQPGCAAVDRRRAEGRPMKRLALRCAAIFLLTIMSCSGSSETTEWCDDACAIWRDCTGWDLNACTGDCRADGDWDAEYLACLRSQPCNNLLACE